MHPDDMLLHPSPLTSSNKQATKRLFSVLAITQSQHSRLYSTLAILEPRWCHCQIEVLSQRLNDGARGAGVKLGGAPQICAFFSPKTAIFRPKTVPKGPRSANHHAKATDLLCSCQRTLLVTSNPTLCPRNSPKMPQMAHNLHNLCEPAPKPRRGRILGYAAQNRFRGHLVHLRTPPPQNCPRCLDHCNSECFGQPQQSPRPAQAPPPPPPHPQPMRVLHRHVRPSHRAPTRTPGASRS